MQQTKFLVFLVLIVIIGGSGLAHSDELYKKNGFSITLPEGWTEMPRDVIDNFEKEFSKLAPNAPAQHYDYGFQLENSENWFEYPYILVQIKNTGRIRENELEQLENFSVQEARDKSEKDFSSVMSDIQVGKMYYDKNAKIVWFRFEANVVDVGLIAGISGMVPTETGFIQVSGYSLAGEFSNDESTFQSVAMSVTPEPALVYKPKWSDSLPLAVSGIDWGNVAIRILVAAIIFGIIALIVGLRKKK